jgi:hypothetical protein
MQEAAARPLVSPGERTGHVLTIVGAVLLLLLVAFVYPLPGGMYTLVRLTTCVAAGWAAVVALRLELAGWIVPLALTAVREPCGAHGKRRRQG